jgi:hypothetical protein
MTHTDFNHLLSSIKTLSPSQMRRLRQHLDRRLAEPKSRPAPPTGESAKRVKAAPPQAEKPLSIDEIHRRMLASGLITSLPDPALDIDDDDPEDQPVVIMGEPLSETILRERR